MIQHDGTRVWVAHLTWSAPTSRSVVAVIPEYRLLGAIIWQATDRRDVTTTEVYLTEGFDDGSTYELRVRAVNGYGLSGSGEAVTAATALPGAPSAPTGLHATSSGSASQRSFDWNDNPERDVKSGGSYDIEITKLVGGVQTQIQLKSVAHSAYTYREKDLQRGVDRYARVRAVNKSGNPGLWSVRVVANGTAVATDDITPGAVNGDPVITSGEPVLVGIHSLLLPVPVTVGHATVTVPAEGASNIDISVDLEVDFGNSLTNPPSDGWGEGGDLKAIGALLLNRGAGFITPSKTLFARTQLAVAGTPDHENRKYHVKWVDPAPQVGVATYVLQVLYIGTGAGHPITVTPDWTIQVNRR